MYVVVIYRHERDGIDRVIGPVSYGEAKRLIFWLVEKLGYPDVGFVRLSDIESMPLYSGVE